MDAAVIALDHPAAFDPVLVGRKAAGLARARAAGLPVGPGVVLTSHWSPDDTSTAHAVWRIISHNGARPLVVRPSSTDRDGRQPAEGVFDEVTAVRDIDAFLAAVDDVRRSSSSPVLIHPLLDAQWRGTLFVDAPDWDRRGWIAEPDHHGRPRHVLSGQHLAHPPVEVLARLVRLSERVDAAFGGPHDIEWAADSSGRVRLLRLRPVIGPSGAAEMHRSTARQAA